MVMIVSGLTSSVLLFKLSTGQNVIVDVFVGFNRFDLPFI